MSQETTNTLMTILAAFIGAAPPMCMVIYLIYSERKRRKRRKRERESNDKEIH